MANYHSDSWIMEHVQEHLENSYKLFPQNQIVGIFAYGSMNYDLDYEESDVDTKLIVLPTFDDIVFTRELHSTTHVMPNNEHIDIKDLRLMLHIFRKQNISGLEILFTKYKWLNPKFADQWERLIQGAELIAHYNPLGAVKTMKGIAFEKYHALEHRYPSKIEILEKYSYDPKQLHHLLRIEEYLERYIAGENYAACLHPQNAEYFGEVKKGLYNLDDARRIAKKAIEHVVEMDTNYYRTHTATREPKVDELLNSVQKNIMYKAMYDYFNTGSEYLT